MLFTFFALMILWAAKAQSTAAPLPTILDVSVSVHGDGRCEVTLLNTYTRPAVAWVLTRIPEQRFRHLTDVSTSPELAIVPGGTRVTRIACLGTETTSALDVVAAVYDDGVSVGNQPILEDLLAGQRKRATALKELAGLLRSAQVNPRPGLSTSVLLGELIDGASGPELDAGARHFAKLALQRTNKGDTSSVTRQQVDQVQNELAEQLMAAAGFLERASRSRR